MAEIFAAPVENVYASALSASKKRMDLRGIL